MKFWKVLGGILVFAGCIAALTGVLATAAPLIENDHVKSIIASFSVKSLEPFINMINGVILFCLQNNYLVFGAGAGAMLVGGLLKTMAARALYGREESSTSTYRESTPKRPRERSKKAADQPQATVPAAPRQAQAATEAMGLSPFAAAAYGKALSGTHTGEGESEIAAKYMPKSIIDNTFSGETAQREGFAQTIQCKACGTPNPLGILFCEQCGSRLYDQHSATGMREQSMATPERKAQPAYIPREHTMEAKPDVRAANEARTASVSQPMDAATDDYRQSFVPPIVSFDADIDSARAENTYRAAERHTAAPQGNNAQASETRYAAPMPVYPSDFADYADESAYGDEDTTQSAIAYTQGHSGVPASTGAQAYQRGMDGTGAAPTAAYIPHHGGAPDTGRQDAYPSPTSRQSYEYPAQPEPAPLAAWHQEPGTPAATQQTQAMPAATQQAQAKPRPRIVSTMGKKSTR